MTRTVTRTRGRRTVRLENPDWTYSGHSAARCRLVPRDRPLNDSPTPLGVTSSPARLRRVRATGSR
ncbi:hypothetical protein C8039_14855 [Halogeometricum sp. wsp3]|nr:hypothetical protein C8039_14855 [Halogeometricum sp. wsp3]